MKKIFALSLLVTDQISIYDNETKQIKSFKRKIKYKLEGIYI